MPGFEHQPDGGACVGIFCADLVFQKPEVGKMGIFRVVHVDHECGRIASHLCSIIQADAFTGFVHRVMQVLGMLQDGVQAAGGDDGEERAYQ